MMEMLRKNVSISNDHLKMLDPLLKKHQGNMSAAMRDIIDFTGFVTQNLGSLEIAKDLLKEKNHEREKTLKRIYGLTIPLTMFRWLLNNRKSSLPPSIEANQLFRSPDINIYDTDKLNKIINEEISYLNWPVSVTVDNENGDLLMQITGMDPEINRFTSILLTMFFMNNRTPQKIVTLQVYPASIYIELTKAANCEEAIQSVCETFCDGEDKTVSNINDLPIISEQASSY